MKFILLFMHVWDICLPCRYVDDTTYVYTRGLQNDILVAVTSLADVDSGAYSVTVPGLEASEGLVYTNIYDSGDVVTVTNGELEISFDEELRPKVYRL